MARHTSSSPAPGTCPPIPEWKAWVPTWPYKDLGGTTIMDPELIRCCQTFNKLEYPPMVDETHLAGNYLSARPVSWNFLRQKSYSSRLDMSISHGKRTPLYHFSYLLKLVVEFSQCSDDTFGADRYEEGPLFNSMVQGDKIVLNGMTLGVRGKSLLVFRGVIEIPIRGSLVDSLQVGGVAYNCVRITKVGSHFLHK